MTKLKKIVIALIVLASAVALSAFFYSDFKEDTEVLNSEEVFLKNFSRLDFRYEDLSTANMLGETFNLTVKVQYDPENIEVFPESLNSVDYTPFEPTGNKAVKVKTLSKEGREIEQLTYSIELVAIQAIAGRSYEISDMNLEFSKKASKTKFRQEQNIAPGVKFSVGEYHPAYLRPLKGKILSSLNEKQTRYLASAGTLLFVVAMISGSWALARVKENSGHRSLLDSKHQLHEIFRDYEDLNWLRSKSAGERMHELENLVVHLAVECGIVRNASGFWEKDNSESWLKMTRCLNKAYSRDGASYQEVLQAASLAKELIVKHALPKKEKTIGRMVFGRSS